MDRIIQYRKLVKRNLLKVSVGMFMAIMIIMITVIMLIIIIIIIIIIIVILIRIITHRNMHACTVLKYG